MSSFGQPQRTILQCPACGKRFTVPSPWSAVPKHPPRSQEMGRGIPYEPCAGTGKLGIRLGPA